MPTRAARFTAAFTGVLTAAAVKISMDGRSRWMDNVFVERAVALTQARGRLPGLRNLKRRVRAKLLSLRAGAVRKHQMPAR